MKMPFIYYFIFLLLLLKNVSAEVPEPFEGYEVNPVDITTNLLTGLYQSDEGLVVCDRGKGALLIFPSNQPGRIFIDHLDTPVDVEKWGDQWLVLQEEAGSLVAVDEETSQIKEIATGFFQPSAFALDQNGHAYILEFLTGMLFRVDLETGEKEEINIYFDRPSDIVFTSENTLIIADQMKLDGRGGTIFFITPEGEILDTVRNITDPTGLAVSQSGEIYVTSFFMHASSNGHGQGQGQGQNNSNAGGIYRLQSVGHHDLIAKGLIGPTSLIVTPDNKLIVLEEPSDSIYQYSLSGNLSPIVEGFTKVKDAVRNKKGLIVAIEKGLIERLRVAQQNIPNQTWAMVDFGNWDQSVLAVDGQDNVYQSEPFLSQINVYNANGKKVKNFKNIVPYLMAGIPSGGVYAFTLSGNTTMMTRLGEEENKKTNLKLNSKISSCIVRDNGNLLLSLSNGELKEITPEGDEIKTIYNTQSGYQFSSMVPDNDTAEGVWLLEENQNEVLYLDETNSTEPVAQLSEDGILLPDDDGVMFLSDSGKRFIIKQTETNVTDWFLH